MRSRTQGLALVALALGAGLIALTSGDTRAVYTGGPWQVQEIVSLSSNYEQGDGSSAGPAVSEDGRYITFSSGSNNFVPGDNDPTDFPFQSIDVFVRDTITGTTEMVNLTDGDQMLLGELAQSSRISDDGSLVAFISGGELTPEPNDGTFSTHMYVRDIFANTTTLVDENAAGNKSARGVSAGGGDISGDGNWAVFPSRDGGLTAGANRAKNCTVGPNPDWCTDVFLKNLQTGALTMIDRGPGGEIAEDNSSGAPRLSDDGGTAVFDSNADNLAPGDSCTGTAGFCVDVFAYDRASDTVELVSKSSSGEHANAESYSGAVSGNGRYVIFQSEATNLVPGDTNDALDVFRHDLQTGTTVLVSANKAGAQGDSASNVGEISDNGRYVSMFSAASNLVPGVDTSCILGANCYNVYVKDMLTGAVALVSANADGDGGDYQSTGSAMSDDGRRIAFISGASDLVPDDNNIECPGADLPYECYEIFLAFAEYRYYGDVNCDGIIDGRDALEITRWDADNSALAYEWCPEVNTQGGVFRQPQGGIPVLWGDMDCNNIVDMRDTLALLMYLAAVNAGDANTSGQCVPIGPDIGSPTPAPTSTATGAPTPTPTGGTKTPTNTPTGTPAVTATKTPTPTPGTKTPSPSPTPVPVQTPSPNCPLPPPVAIPDGDTVTGVVRTGVFSNTDTIADLDICINVTHQYAGDIKVTLKHVDTGTVVTLIDQMGAPGTSTFGCGGENIYVLLDDEATDPIEDECSGNPAAFGVFSPNNPLSAFDGESFGGTWEVRFFDMEADFTGTSDGAFLWYFPE